MHIKLREPRFPYDPSFYEEGRGLRRTYGSLKGKDRKETYGSLISTYQSNYVERNLRNIVFCHCLGS